MKWERYCNMAESLGAPDKCQLRDPACSAQPEPKIPFLRLPPPTWTFDTCVHLVCAEHRAYISSLGPLKYCQVSLLQVGETKVQNRQLPCAKAHYRAAPWTELLMLITACDGTVWGLKKC